MTTIEKDFVAFFDELRSKKYNDEYCDDVIIGAYALLKSTDTKDSNHYNTIVIGVKEEVAEILEITRCCMYLDKELKKRFGDEYYDSIYILKRTELEYVELKRRWKEGYEAMISRKISSA